MSRNLGPVLCLVAFNWVADAQVTAKIDFERDVQPILKANCYGCHGSSRLYLRLIGHDRIGMPMPPTGSLPAGQIEIIRNWIDQGAAPLG